MAAKNVLGLAYGIDVKPKNDPYVELAERAMNSVSEAGRPGGYLVDFLPCLKYVPSWFPGAQFQSDAEAYLKDFNSLREVPYDFAKKAMASRCIFCIK
jgi:hypothetical protein